MGKKKYICQCESTFTLHRSMYITTNATATNTTTATIFTHFIITSYLFKIHTFQQTSTSLNYLPIIPQPPLSLSLCLYVFASFQHTAETTITEKVTALSSRLANVLQAYSTQCSIDSLRTMRVQIIRWDQCHPLPPLSPFISCRSQVTHRYRSLRWNCTFIIYIEEYKTEKVSTHATQHTDK